MKSKILAIAACGVLAFCQAGRAAVVSLYSGSGPFTTNNTNQFFSFDNPLTDKAGDDVFDTAGSLFFGGTLTRGSGISYGSLGIYTQAGTSTTNGAVDLLRNSATTGFAIFDYLDNKGAGSATARVGGSPDVTIDVGTYRVVGEIEFTSSTSGVIRAWVTNGSTGALEFDTPNVVTTFSSGFSGSPLDLYLRIGSGSGGNSVFSNLNVVWAESGVDRATAFAAVPEPGSMALAFLGVGLVVSVSHFRRR